MSKRFPRNGKFDNQNPNTPQSYKAVTSFWISNCEVYTSFHKDLFIHIRPLHPKSKVCHPRTEHSRMPTAIHARKAARAIFFVRRSSRCLSSQKLRDDVTSRTSVLGGEWVYLFKTHITHATSLSKDVEGSFLLVVH